MRHRGQFTSAPTVKRRKRSAIWGEIIKNNNRKQFWTFIIFRIPTDSPYSHILSAMGAGFVSSTSTNPIWFVKTRLQLDFNSDHKMTVRDCIRGIYRESGLRGFYKGITASYFGISETVVHFVIYETLKRKLVSWEFFCLNEFIFNWLFL